MTKPCWWGSSPRKGTRPPWAYENNSGGYGCIGLGFVNGDGEGEFGCSGLSDADEAGGDETLETLEMYLDTYGDRRDKILSGLEALAACCR